jgi:hypothetical protein
MKLIKTYETWNNNIIDKSLFASGRAKYKPKVVGNSITYKTGVAEPYYHAEIKKKGGKFICKIYKKKKDGEDIRLRNKLKKTLKLAHNYVREFLNQRLKKDSKKTKKKSKSKKDIERIIREEPQIQPVQEFEPKLYPSRKNKTIIRRF